MYSPEFQMNQSGIPIVSGEELDVLGERLAVDFSSERVFIPDEIDIDRFLTVYLGLRQDFCYLSHCGVYLGMTIFQDTNYIPVYDPERNQAEFISAKAGTVIIDSSLLEANQEHRYRFTMGHEGSHKILHAAYFLNSVRKGSPYSKESETFIRCRADQSQINSISSFLWTDARRVEWQANRLSSAILMPKSAVRILMAHLPNRGEIGWLQNASFQVSKVFNVSIETAFYRLKDLGLIDKDITFES